MEGRKNGATKLRLLGALLILAAMVLVYRHLDTSGLLQKITDTQWLHRQASELGVRGPLLIVGVMALAIVINPIPSAPIALAAGAMFGSIWGTLYVIIGAEIGALIAFGIARAFGRDLLCRLFGEQVLLGWLGSQNALTWMVFVSRLLPFLSFDLVSYGAGLTPIKAWRFALATLLGVIPISFLLAHFGGEIAGPEMNRAMNTILVIGLLVMIPVAVKLFRIARSPEKNNSGRPPDGSP